MTVKTKSINSFQVNPIGIGTWGFSGGKYADKTPFAVYGNEKQEIAAIQTSISQGQNHIDTAQMYGLGHTEEVVGLAIAGFKREALFIASKLWKTHLKGDAILFAIEASLKRLKIAYLDLFYLHGYWPDYEPLASQLEGLNLALNRGLIKGIGVSNFSLPQLQEAQALSASPIVAIQNYYSLANKSQTSQELLGYCNTNAIAFVAAKPLERGLFGDEKWQHALKPFCEKYQKTASQIALQWLLAQTNVHCIPKALSPGHIQENLAATSFALTPEDFNDLSRLSS